ncbi:MAG: hypothetical protein ABIP39_07055, partial [Polyangiaceae bacterium]
MPIKNAFPMFPSGSGGSNDKSPASTSGSIALSGAWFDLQMAYQRMKSVYGGLQKMYAGRGGVPKSFADRYEALSAEYRLTGDYGETGELNAVQPTAAAEIRAKRDLTQRIVAATTDMQRALNAGGGKEKPIPEVPLPGFPHPTMGPREDGPDLPFQWGDPEGPIDRGPGIARGGDPNFDFGSSSYHGTGLGDGTASRDGGKKGFPGSSGYHGTGLDDGTARGDGTKKGFSGYQGTGLNDGMVSRKGKGTRDVSPSDGTGVFRPGTSTQGSSGSNSSQGTSSGGGSR